MIKASEAEKNMSTQIVSTPTQQQKKLTRVYVRNIPPCIKSKHLMELFSACGEVRIIEVEKKQNSEYLKSQGKIHS
jgi:hypothetical protein